MDSQQQQQRREVESMIEKLSIELEDERQERRFLEKELDRLLRSSPRKKSSRSDDNKSVLSTNEYWLNLLKSPLYYRYFKEFLREHKTLELLWFYEEVQRFKNLEYDDTLSSAYLSLTCPSPDIPNSNSNDNNDNDNDNNNDDNGNDHDNDSDSDEDDDDDDDEHDGGRGYNELRKRAFELYKKYIKSGNEYELNIGKGQREEIEQRLRSDRIRRGMFSNILDEVSYLLKNEHLITFLGTDRGSQFSNSLKKL